MSRQPSRLEALAVLRGERDYHKRRGNDVAVVGIETAIEVLEGKRAPSGCEYESEPPHLRKKVDFIGGLLE